MSDRSPLMVRIRRQPFTVGVMVLGAVLLVGSWVLAAQNNYGWVVGVCTSAGAVTAYVLWRVSSRKGRNDG